MKLTKRAVGACARAEFKRSPLVLAMVAAMSIHASAQAESFPAEIDLSDLDGSNGFRILGGAGFFVGNSVSSAGDFNGDGFADIVLGDRYGDGTNYDPFPYPGDVNFNRPPGAAYILFGGADVGSTGTFQLSAPDGTDGILISGYDDEDGLGFSVSDAGDINGDGFADVIIGAPEAESVYSATYDASGTSYIVFGGADVGNTGFLSQATVASGENGFVITGVDNVDQSGFSVSSAGDINGDGAADVIVGAPYAGANRSGQSYVVFGGTDAGTNPVDLSELDGSNGFTIDGSDSDYLLGSSVSVAGDFNGDGLSDIIVGKPYIDGTDTGEAIVLFGGDNVGASGTVDLSSLDGTNSLVISGIPSYGFGAFFPVSDAGDFNGDGLSDVIIGARYADPNGNEQAGQSFIVFGGDNVGESGTLDLADLDGSNGLVIDGLNAYDALGNAVSSAGDVNGDGVDDVIIGAANADPSGIPYAGQSFVVFGGSDVGSSGEFDLTSLDGSNGFVLSGIDEFNGVGTAVSTAGDFNGDGVSDLVVGSYEAGPGFVVFGVQEPVTSGGPDPEPTLSCNGLPVTVNLALGQSPTSGADVILGTEGADTIRALGGNDTICGLGGDDVINAGSGDDFVDAGPGNDSVFGLSGADVLRGRSGADRIFGGGGEDLINGDGGADGLNGGGGDDLIFGGGGDDGVFGQNGNDTLFGGNGDDLITGAAGNDTLNGGAGSDRLVGDSNVNQAGDDTLDGGAGADELVGRAGNDNCVVDSADTSSDCS